MKINISISGTAREACENYNYSSLVKKYEEKVAEDIIKIESEKIEITTSEFRTYRKTKKIIQDKWLDVKQARK